MLFNIEENDVELLKTSTPSKWDLVLRPTATDVNKRNILIKVLPYPNNDLYKLLTQYRVKQYGSEKAFYCYDQHSINLNCPITAAIKEMNAGSDYTRELAKLFFKITERVFRVLVVYDSLEPDNNGTVKFIHLPDKSSRTLIDKVRSNSDPCFLNNLEVIQLNISHRDIRVLYNTLPKEDMLVHNDLVLTNDENRDVFTSYLETLPHISSYGTQPNNDYINNRITSYLNALKS